MTIISIKRGWEISFIPDITIHVWFVSMDTLSERIRTLVESIPVEKRPVDVGCVRP